jgi:hypothetical protein
LTERNEIGHARWLRWTEAITAVSLSAASGLLAYGPSAVWSTWLSDFLLAVAALGAIGVVLQRAQDKS